MKRVLGNGPIPARIMVIGEAPGPEEEFQGRAFIGTSGQLLRGMLKDAGIDPAECYFTNVYPRLPPVDRWGQRNTALLFEGTEKSQKMSLKAWANPKPELITAIQELRDEVRRVNPIIILAAGGLALWAITGKIGIAKWRGSELITNAEWGDRRLVPTYNPAYVQRVWSEKVAVSADLRRLALGSRGAWDTPGWEFGVAPNFTDAMAWLDAAAAFPIWSVDIETRNWQIACFGIATSDKAAFCIPFMSVDKSDGCYWTFDEEILIRRRLRELLMDPRREIIGQNFDYDAQYILARLGVLPPVKWDTMIMHHQLYIELAKSLDFMASLYCRQYVYWKDDGKTFDPRKDPEVQHWRYNCEDAARTYEIAMVLKQHLIDSGQLALYEHRVGEVLPLLLKMMLRGVAVDPVKKAEFHNDLLAFEAEMLRGLEAVLGHPVKPNSPKQISTLFYTDFGLAPIKDRRTGAVTVKDDALEVIAKRQPLLRGVVERIAAYRSARVLRSNVADMLLDSDGRARTYFKITGTDTFRLSSSENVFNTGGNFQNITTGYHRKDDLEEPPRFQAPNMRKMFVTDGPEWEFADVDLDRADLVIVVWEADDRELKQMIREGEDVHKHNAALLFKKPATRVSKAERQFAKVFCHGTNYLGQPRTMAAHCSITVAEAEQHQRLWFSAHPGIQAWHRREEIQLKSRRKITNVFGYQRMIFDRPDGALGRILAWKPQSCVSHIINAGLVRLDQRVPEAQVLLQVHDSGGFQYRRDARDKVLRMARECFSIPLPYPDPVTLGVGLQISPYSWGDVKEPDRGSEAWLAWHGAVASAA
jgi:DNA polymerase I-like protein with 3'-5' exonuclease and polymerase domains/uracil-DNA glycosylase